jgi:delta-aminolevulinic acid dehydratase/porphobilinogen synthase
MGSRATLATSMVFVANVTSVRRVAELPICQSAPLSGIPLRRLAGVPLSVAVSRDRTTELCAQPSTGEAAARGAKIIAPNAVTAIRVRNLPTPLDRSLIDLSVL